MVSKANIAHYDEFWQKRVEDAKIAAHVEYHPKPEEVVNQLNHEVHLSVTGRNNTRRKLHKKYDGPCMITNPINQCWRCDRNWAKNRQKLAECVRGFGRKTTGGKDGKIYVVTDPSDNDMVNPKPGTLRHAVIQPEPLWIIFGRDMVIRLSEELIMTGNKTIDGRGAQVHIAHGAGNGGMIRDSTTHYGFRTRSDGDGISLFGAVNVWIDHISMSNCQDGLIDLVEGSTAVTISNCHFTHHNDVLLFGASDTHPQDKIMQVTKRTHAPESEWRHWIWKSDGDLLTNGAFFIPSGDPEHKFKMTEDMIISPKPGSYVSSLTRFSGALTALNRPHVNLIHKL
ncbi:hypothetical protein L6452_34381 [Arctium lappa]|uniref:Uncharacterized protein n=1 Tax=Arctium lappa TaxID=4217 RepID=A0ACB8YHF2_ARCLA|nr:hypothetical protein L6452_34381 [Arctium lappa]